MLANLNIIEIPKTVEAIVCTLKTVGDGWSINNDEISELISDRKEPTMNLWYKTLQTSLVPLEVYEVDPDVSYWEWPIPPLDVLKTITFLDLLKQYKPSALKEYGPVPKLADIYI